MTGGVQKAANHAAFDRLALDDHHPADFPDLRDRQEPNPSAPGTPPILGGKLALMPREELSQGLVLDRD